MGIRDKLQVQECEGQHCLWFRGEYRGEHMEWVIARYFDPDDAWGVASLIVEYVEVHGRDDEAAIYAALTEYDEACHLAGMAPEGDGEDMARQDHYALMAVA